jgi:bacterial/archaeal transporter family-2 protein
MNSTMTYGVLVAIGAGIAIGLQGLFTTITGQEAGSPLRGGVFVHFTGLLVGLVLLFVTSYFWQADKGLAFVFTPRLILFAFLAGAAGMCILIGIATAFPLIGLGAGQAAAIFAQMLVGVIVDYYGLAGGEPIPLDWRRILGLFVLAIGIYLILPQSPQASTT